MMQNLLLEEGALLSITNISLPKATFVKLQPQHTDFLEISNPRAVLEHALRNFSCVTKGDVICVPYNNKNYHFMLKEVQPQDAACIIETDCNVDFDAPVGYVDPSIANNKNAAANKKKAYNFVKQSATGGTPRTLSPSSSSSVNADNGADNNATAEDGSFSGPRTRIVNGEVVVVTNDSTSNSTTNIEEHHKIDPKLMASQTGATGVQLNAASVQSTNKAATVDYWAVNAGGGARLDGKTATPLKDKDGNEVNVRELRALAAAKRVEQLFREEEKKKNEDSSSANNKPAQSRVRQSRVKGKYSKRKNGVESFHGSGKSM